MVIHSGSANGDSGGVDVLELEFLQGVSRKISDIALSTAQRHAKASRSECSLEDGFVKRLSALT